MHKATVISSRLHHSWVVPTVFPLASLAVCFATTRETLHKQNLRKTSKTVDMYNTIIYYSKNFSSEKKRYHNS